MIGHDAVALKERELGADSQLGQGAQTSNAQAEVEEQARQERIAYLYNKILNKTAEPSSQSEEQSLLLEVGESLSVSLQEHFKSKDVQYTIQDKPLDLDELFGVNGLLMIFFCAIPKHHQGVDVGLSWYFVIDDTALASVVLRLDGNPFDFASVMKMRNAIIEIANGLKITKVDGENLCAVDELYQAFYDMAQGGKLKLKEESDSRKESASQFAKRIFSSKCYGLAEGVMRKVHKIRATILGDEHLSSLECQHRIAACLLQQGKQLAAQTLLLETSEKLKCVYGAGHEESLRAQSRLAVAYIQSGEIQSAKDLLKKAEKQSTISLGEDHLLTKTLIKQLGGILKLHPDVAIAAVGEGKHAGAVGETLEPERTIIVCDKTSFQTRLKQETDKEHEKKLAGLKAIAQPKRLPHIPAQVFVEIERIGREQLNFSKVTELILNTLHAQAITGRAAQLPPMLLVGPPGVGKTRYIKRIAAVLGVPFTDVQLAGVPDGFRISGLSRYWGTAGEGAVANAFVMHDVANPVFLLDEIDKTKVDEKSDPLSVILLLLEKESSRSFRDLFIDIPLDVSHASFIATANDISELPEPILSRFHCIEVQPLDYEGRCTMIKTSYTELLAEEGLLGFLDQEIAPSALDALACCEALTGRDVKREILLAMQRACRTYKLGQQKQSITLSLEHLRLPEKKISRAIGFMA